MSIRSNLGRIAECGQFFVYRLSEWDGAKWRRKQPWGNGHPVSPSDPSNWSSYDAMAARVAALPTSDTVTWAVGLWITADLDIFFLDIDKLPADYTLDDEATSLLQQFPGCMVEWSSSRRGLHIIGSHNGPVRHGKRAGRLELYTDERGIALGTTASGTVDTNCNAALAALIDSTFPPPALRITPPVAPGAAVETDMGALALALRQAEKIVKAPDGERNHTLNTAAYVLGGMVGAGRISRAEARAALVSAVERAGWGNMPLQLSKIDQALDSGVSEPIVLTAPVAAMPPGPAATDWHSITDQAISNINNTGTYRELTDTVIPAIGELRIPKPHSERVVQALARRLELFDAKQPIGEVRRLVTPPATNSALVDSTPPDWFAGMCYVKRNDKFFNVTTGSEYTAEGFRTEYSRFMPFTTAGKREDPVQWARERWNIVTVDDTMYHPTQEPFFTHGGKQYANTFNPASMPAITEPSQHCAMCIQAFQNHLYMLCNQRDWLYNLLLQWLAFNVQHPGHKIRWSPLIKGVQGDGKSIVGDLIFEVMGEANVKITSPSNISNKGGFTDWATGKAVNFIEEIRLEGREKHALYNAMKLFVGDTRTDVNRKGRAAGDTMPNVMNHWANSNYGDAIPVDPRERRWLIVFSPYTTIEDAAAAKGLPDADSLVRHFKMLGMSMRAEPGAWRGWLMSIDTSQFDPDGRAPDTPERESMRLMSGNTMDQAIVDILEAGGHGITKDCFSSACLLGMVKIKTGENPDNRGWNSTLTRLGYLQMTKTVWWNGSSHRIWAKKSLTNDEIREILEKT